MSSVRVHIFEAKTYMEVGHSEVIGTRPAPQCQPDSHFGSRPAARPPVIRLIALLLAAFPGIAADFSARVIRIVDGDTIDVLVSDRDQVRVRLYGIDAP